MSISQRNKVLLLFDVDGTLTKPRNKICVDFEQFLNTRVKSNYFLGLVGGSDLGKIKEQMKDDVINVYDYIFPENGLIAYKDGKMIASESIQNFVGEDKLQTFINFVLKYLSGIVLPVKRGTFVEFRSGMLNISPIGRSCSQAERDDFEQYDKEHSIRRRMIEELRKEFQDWGFSYSIGGQISFDVFPNGWDKTYCLKHVENDGFEEIHFFGDKTDPGGNDHEIFNDPRTIGHKVSGPDDTKEQLKKLFHL